MSDFWARMPPFRDSNSSRRSDCSVASARNACSWVMFVFHSSRWSSVRSSVVLSSVVDSVLPSVVGRLAVGRCRWSLPLVVLSSVVRSVVGCRPSVVVVVRQSLVVGCLVGRPSSVSLPGPSASELSRDSLPNSLPPRSSRLSSSASRATHCQPAFLLSASVDSSDNRLGCLARASLRFPPPGFRLWVRFARPLPLLVFEAPFSSLAFPRLLEIAWFRPVLVASPVSADLSRACPAPFPPVAWPPPRVSFFTSSAPRVRFRASFWVPSGSLLGPFWVPSGSSFLASLPHFSGRPVHPSRLPALHDLPWVGSDSHFPGSCSSFPSSASGVFSSLREGASIPPLHVMHFLSLPHSFFAMTGFWLSPILYFVPYSSFSSYLPWVLLHF